MGEDTEAGVDGVDGVDGDVTVIKRIYDIM